MDALIKISSSEFNEEVYNKIKAMIRSFGTSEITISVSNRSVSALRTETPTEYWERLDRSIKDLEDGKGVVFTMDELEAFVHGKLDK